jgi:hypothetical protein
VRPEAVAVRVTDSEGAVFWIGPAALTIVTGSGDLALLPAAPNPFNPETTLRYSIPREGMHRVSLEILDVRGRTITILVDSVQSGGSYHVRWDGTDSRGLRVAAGVYLVVLDVGGRRMTQKVVLLK